MSSPPPGDNDQRGAELSEPDSKLGTVKGTSEAGAAEMVSQASLLDPAADIALYDEEAAAFSGAPKRGAPLVHEAAHVRERYLGLEREAAKGYATSLTLDPSFAPNAWSLRRVFVRRAFWDNL